MTFDSANDSLVGFVVYTDSLWQIGTPNKNVFDSAYSAPFALVTDTVDPYPDNTDTSYAELAIPYYRDLTGWMPQGANVEVSFRHREDMNPTAARGWIELYQDSLTMPYASSFGWKRLWDFEWYDGSIYTPCALDTAGNFTGYTNPNWSDCQLEFGCHGVFTSSLEFFSIDTLRMRFAFSRSSNPDGRDGWMIDDIQVLSYQCIAGSIAENESINLRTYPSPTSDFLRAQFDTPTGTQLHGAVFNSAGQLVLEQDASSSNGFLEINVSDLPSGLYSLRIRDESKKATARFIVAR